MISRNPKSYRFSGRAGCLRDPCEGPMHHKSTLKHAFDGCQKQFRTCQPLIDATKTMVLQLHDKQKATFFFSKGSHKQEPLHPHLQSIIITIIPNIHFHHLGILQGLYRKLPQIEVPAIGPPIGTGTSQL